MTLKRTLLGLLAAAALLIVSAGFTECQTPTTRLAAAKTAEEARVAALKADYDTRLKAQQTEAAAAQAAVVAAKDAQINGASTPLYAADVAFKGIPAPTRTDLIINGRVNEAWSALGHRMPTYEEMQAANARLAAELDENRTTLAQLKATHETEMARGQTLADATAAAAKAMTDLTARHAREREELSGKVTAATQALADANAQLAAAEKASANDAKARQAQLARLSWGAGIIAALCLAGALFSPVLKQELAVGALILGGAAVAIPFITPLIVLSGTGAAAACVIAWVVVKHRRADRAADALSLVTQDLRDKGGDIAAATNAAMADRTARYVKARDGTLVTEPDHALVAQINAKVAEYDHLPSAAAPAAVVTPHP